MAEQSNPNASESENQKPTEITFIRLDTATSNEAVSSTHDEKTEEDSVVDIPMEEPKKKKRIPTVVYVGVIVGLLIGVITLVTPNMLHTTVTDNTKATLELQAEPTTINGLGGFSTVKLYLNPSTYQNISTVHAYITYPADLVDIRSYDDWTQPITTLQPIEPYSMQFRNTIDKTAGVINFSVSASNTNSAISAAPQILIAEFNIAPLRTGSGTFLIDDNQSTALLTDTNNTSVYGGSIPVTITIVDSNSNTNGSNGNDNTNGNNGNVNGTNGNNNGGLEIVRMERDSSAPSGATIPYLAVDVKVMTYKISTTQDIVIKDIVLYNDTDASGPNSPDALPLDISNIKINLNGFVMPGTIISSSNDPANNCSSVPRSVIRFSLPAPITMAANTTRIADVYVDVTGTHQGGTFELNSGALSSSCVGRTYDNTTFKGLKFEKVLDGSPITDDESLVSGSSDLFTILGSNNNNNGTNGNTNGGGGNGNTNGGNNNTNSTNGNNNGGTTRCYDSDHNGLFDACSLVGAGPVCSNDPLSVIIDCTTPKGCNPITAQCVDGGTGGSCTSNNQCTPQQNKCIDTNQDGVYDSCGLTGTGSILCSNASSCTIAPTPLGCSVAHQCVRGGTGGSCSTNTDCSGSSSSSGGGGGTRYHMGCFNAMCIRVAGVGTDECARDIDCSTTNSNTNSGSGSSSGGGTVNHAPHFINITPAPNSVGNQQNPKITYEIVDPEGDTINRASVKMMVNGRDVLPDITGQGGHLYVSYQMTSAVAWENFLIEQAYAQSVSSRVYVRLEAADSKTPPASNQVDYSFVIGNNESQTVLCSTPLALSATTTGTSVTLHWTEPTDPNISGYTLYIGTSANNLSRVEHLGKLNTITLGGFTAGQTYYFVLTATGTCTESNYSNMLAMKVGTGVVPGNYNPPSSNPNMPPNFNPTLPGKLPGTGAGIGILSIAFGAYWLRRKKKK